MSTLGALFFFMRQMLVATLGLQLELLLQLQVVLETGGTQPTFRESSLDGASRFALVTTVAVVTPLGQLLYVEERPPQAFLTFPGFELAQSWRIDDQGPSG